MLAQQGAQEPSKQAPAAAGSSKFLRFFLAPASGGQPAGPHGGGAADPCLLQVRQRPLLTARQPLASVPAAPFLMGAASLRMHAWASEHQLVGAARWAGLAAAGCPLCRWLSLAPALPTACPVLVVDDPPARLARPVVEAACRLVLLARAALALTIDAAASARP
jgi:hypothetical protein